MNLFIVKPSFRLVITVAKSVSSKAVQRNRVKRLLREAIHSLSTKPKLKIIALPPILGKSFQEIKMALEQAIKKI